LPSSLLAFSSSVVRIELDDFLVDSDPESTSSEEEQTDNLQTLLDQAAAERIPAVLKEVRGVRAEAARRLGVDCTTLYRLMRKYRISGAD